MAVINNAVSTEFVVNKEKRTIVCIITTEGDVLKRLGKYDIETGDDYWRYGNDRLVRRYKGVAKCAPEDEWDEAYGKKLAEYRAAKARQVDVNKDLDNAVEKLRLGIEKLTKYGYLKEPRRVK